MTDNTHVSDESPRMSAPLTVRTWERDGVVIVSVTGELDMSTVGQVAVASQDAVTRGVPVVLDMTGLRFFSSAGLRLLVRLHETASVDVRLAGDQRVVLRPLELTGLLDLFPVHASVADAVAAALG
jgi:anti-sigma B factor antagonist